MAVKVPKNTKKASEDVLVAPVGNTPVEDFDSVVKAEETKVENINKSEESVNPEETKVEPTKAVSFVDETSAPQAVRTVKVKTNTDHACTIGGVRYFFTAGKQQNVPETVKDILLKAGLLSPI